MKKNTNVKGNVLLLGATSDIAAALAEHYALHEYSVSLAARDLGRLSVMAADLTIKYRVPVQPYQFDALDFKSHEMFYQSLVQKPDVVICVFGYLGDQQRAQLDWKECARILDSNFTGAVSILNVVANAFAERRSGVIVGITSVAGDRGRQSNYIYGSAKAGFTAYLSGLRNRLFHSNVHVLTVKPGFMKTRMIEGLKTPAPLTALPSAVAPRIYKAIVRQKNIIYVLPIWWLIMLVIRSIPEFIFKKLKL